MNLSSKWEAQLENWQILPLSQHSPFRNSVRQVRLHGSSRVLLNRHYKDILHDVPALPRLSHFSCVAVMSDLDSIRLIGYSYGAFRTIFLARYRHSLRNSMYTERSSNYTQGTSNLTNDEICLKLTDLGQEHPYLVVDRSIGDRFSQSRHRSPAIRVDLPSALDEAFQTPSGRPSNVPFGAWEHRERLLEPTSYKLTLPVYETLHSLQDLQSPRLVTPESENARSEQLFQRIADRIVSPTL